MSTANQPVGPGPWEPDLLGPGFRSRTLSLRPDESDDGAVATLVRHVPAEDPLAIGSTPSSPAFALLYVHGWNDYFFQHHLAREVSRLGGAFHALDLRRYGRSLRTGQLPGWVTSLSTYDEEIGLALSLAREGLAQDAPVVLMGHSLGGLITSLWAHRHPGAVDALVLNSPWLEIQGAAPARVLGTPVVRALSLKDPRMALSVPVTGGEPMDVARGWTAADGKLPDPTWEKDPYVTGWDLNDAWRPVTGVPLRPGWLLAVTRAQSQVAHGLDVRCPVLCLAAARTHLSVTRTADSRRADTLVDADAVARRAVRLGPLVTVARFEDGVHDLLLSAPPVREQVLSALRRWLSGYVLR